MAFFDEEWGKIYPEFQRSQDQIKGLLWDVEEIFVNRTQADMVKANRAAGFQPLEPTLSRPEIHRLSPSALAYLGDGVYELYIRRYYLLPPQRSLDYHRQVVQQVKAESQAAHLQTLQPNLTELELDILRRGRNAAKRPPKRLDPEIYQQATSFEVLVGYLYLTDPPRLWQLLSQLSLSSSFPL